MNRIGLSQQLALRQTQALVMTPQLQQAIKMLQLSNLELADYVDAEIEQNPLLERGEGESEDGGPPPEPNASEPNGAAAEAGPTTLTGTAGDAFPTDGAEHWDAAAGAEGDGSADYGSTAFTGDNTPWRGRTLTISTASSRRRATWREIRWRRTPSRARKVSTMAPIIATSRMRPEA